MRRGCMLVHGIWWAAMTTTARDAYAGTNEHRQRDAESARSRPILKTGNVPNGRAIIGGLLVVIAVLGLLAAYRSSTKVRTIDYLVARADIPAGRVITADDLALAPMVLYRDSARQAFTRPDDVIGKLALIAVSNGTLIQRHALADRILPERGRRLSIELEPAQALSGRIEPGDRVDVVSTPTGDAPASVIERNALITNVDGLGDASDVAVGGSSARVTVTLVVPDEDASRRIIDAKAHGTVTLVGASAMTLDTSTTIAPAGAKGAGG